MQLCAEEDVPVVMKMKVMSTQTEPDVHWEGIDLPDYNGNLLMSFTKLENFIHLATGHSAQRGKQIVLQHRQLKDSTKIHHVWKCPCCCVELLMENCDIIRSPEVAEDAAFSRSQPDFNI